MPRRFQLQDHNDGDYDEAKRQTCVLITGDEKYYDVLKSAFPDRCSKMFEDKRKMYDWEVYIHCDSIEEHESIQKLLNMLAHMHKM